MAEHSQSLPSDVVSAIPPEEKVLWSGRPEWKALAYHSFGLKYLVFYLIFAALYCLAELDGAIVFGLLLTKFLPYCFSGILAGLVLTGLAYFQALNTAYVVTEKRIVIRSGVALVFLLNAPFKKISSIDKQILKNSLGNFSFTTNSKRRIPFLSCWPSVKPWSFIEPKPAFKCIANADKIEEIILNAAKNQLSSANTSLKDNSKEIIA